MLRMSKGSYLRFHGRLAVTAACMAAVVVAALGTAAGTSQAARQTGTARLTWAKLAKMTPVQVAVLQKPLLAVASPLQEVGSRAMRGVYGTTFIDTPGHAVDLYVTDPSQAAALIAAARRRAPGLDTGLIRVKRTAYSAASLTAAGRRLIAASIAKRLPFALHGTGQLDRGASLRLMVDNAAQARKLSHVPLASLGGRSVAKLAGVRLTFEQARGAPLTRENDALPFIGGNYITDGGDSCTAGISIESSNNRDFLITANHCFTSGSTVSTENGNTVGIPWRYNANWDAEAIDTGKFNGAGANADEGESNTSNGGIKWYPLAGNAQPLVGGQQICQDGISSYMYRNAVPCNIGVEGTITPQICGQNGPCEYVTEVAAATLDGNPVVIQGDSGAVVFDGFSSPTTRLAAGMVSYGWGGGNPVSPTNPLIEYYHLGFVWWQNLYNAFGFTGRLNPHT